jgi:hypothetical protein
MLHPELRYVHATLEERLASCERAAGGVGTAAVTPYPSLSIMSVTLCPLLL